MPLFEVAIIQLQAKKKVDEESADDELILPPTPIIAKDKDAAILKVTMEHATAFANVNKDRMKVLVRPFV